MSVPAKLLKSNKPELVLGALKKATLYELHGGIAHLHIPKEVVQVIAKTHASENPKTYKELEEKAKGESGKKLVRYAKKVETKLVEFVKNECMDGFGCVAGKGEQVVQGLIRKSTQLEVLLQDNEIQAVVGYGRAGTGKFGRKLIFQNKVIQAGEKKKKDAVYTAYKGKRLVEIDVLAGADERNAAVLLNYVIAHRCAKSSGVIIQTVAGKDVARTLGGRGFKQVYAHVKRDGAYKQLRLPEGVVYMALVDTPKTGDDEKVHWLVKFAKAFETNADNQIDLCPPRGAKDAWRQHCQF